MRNNVVDRYSEAAALPAEGFGAELRSGQGAPPPRVV